MFESEPSAVAIELSRYPYFSRCPKDLKSVTLKMWGNETFSLHTSVLIKISFPLYSQLFFMDGVANSTPTFPLPTSRILQ